MFTRLSSAFPYALLALTAFVATSHATPTNGCGNFCHSAIGFRPRMDDIQQELLSRIRRDGRSEIKFYSGLFQLQQCSFAPLQTNDVRQRPEQVLQNAEAIGCRKHPTPSCPAFGNHRLNLASIASLFNTWLCLEPFDEQEAKDHGAGEHFHAEGERGVGAFTLWLNSLGIESAVFDLFENLHDELIILQAFDNISPRSVIWRRVSEPKVGDTNYAVELGIRIGWASNVLMLNITIHGAFQYWQTHQRHRHALTDQRNRTKATLGGQSIRSFNDLAIATGLDLLRPGIVDPAVAINVDDSGACQDRQQNFLLRQLHVKLRTQTKDSVLPMRTGKATVRGSIANVIHTINEDRWTESKNHIDMREFYNATIPAIIQSLLIIMNEWREMSLHTMARRDPGILHDTFH
ncbi:calponin homology domain-containing protein [Suillus lakei]|nr:calponin homology domain-containing protein [Suillus lakei]